MPAVSVGVMVWRLLPRPQTLATAPVSMRSRLTVLSVAPRSTAKREFCRTRYDDVPITNTSCEPGPVAIWSPVWIWRCGTRRSPLIVASPTSSTMLLRCCAWATAAPPIAVHAAAACRKLRRWNQRTSSSVRPLRVCCVMLLSRGWSFVSDEAVAKTEVDRRGKHRRQQHDEGKEHALDQLGTANRHRDQRRG